MISVTRLNGQKFVLNAELIRTIEESPDTIITLISGEVLIVSEPSKEIVKRVIEFERHVRRLCPPA